MVLLTHWLVLQWAPLPSDQLSVRDFVSVSAQSLVGASMGPSPTWQAVNEWTVHGPTQPLVSAAVGPSPKQAPVNEWPLVGHSANGQQSNGRHVESEERGRSWFSTQGPLAHLASGRWVSWRAQEIGQGLSCWAPEPLPRSPNGQAQALKQWWTSPPSLPLWPNGSGSLHRMQSLGPGPPHPHPVWVA